MKIQNISLYLLLLTILSSYTAYGQFDSLIFKKSLNLNFAYRDIYPLGDQNRDGYDNFMLYDCSEESGYLYENSRPLIQVICYS